VSAILHRPTIAFLDEPFSGLDPLNQELVSGMIRELANTGMTIVLSAHQMDLVDKLADVLVLLSHGEKILEGPIEHVRRTYPIPRELFVVYSQPPTDPIEQGRFQIEKIGGHSLRIIGTEETTKSDLIRFAAELGEIEQISSQVLKLHDVYVRAVKEHVSGRQEVV
jgi:ABC-2 type transport system ATP-binding protein